MCFRVLSVSATPAGRDNTATSWQTLPTSSQLQPASVPVRATSECSRIICLKRKLSPSVPLYSVLPFVFCSQLPEGGVCGLGCEDVPLRLRGRVQWRPVQPESGVAGGEHVPGCEVSARPVRADRGRGALCLRAGIHRRELRHR